VKENSILSHTSPSKHSGLEDINHSSLIKMELDLLVTIVRTARVARFIRASTMVKSTSKINWYFFQKIFSPSWYFHQFRKRDVDRGQSSIDQDLSDGREGHVLKKQDLHSLKRPSLWSVLHFGALVESSHLSDANDSRSQKAGICGRIKGLLHSLGLLRNVNEELNRHVAATKIQRAWRATMNQHRNITTQGASEDDAWAPSREFSSDPPEAKSQKRHLLRPYNSPSSQAFKANPISPQKSVLPMSAKSNNQTRNSVSRRRPESQVGSAMRELTGQRVAIGIIVALVLTVIFTYSENDATRPASMIVLHGQTKDGRYASVSLKAARSSAIPDLYQYYFTNGTVVNFTILGDDPDTLRDKERLQILIIDHSGLKTVGFFSRRIERRDAAIAEICSTIFILLVWFFGVTAFAGPVMTLVVVPIERMVRLLGMLMLDPLGYQSTPRYKKFVAEEEELTKNTRWTKEVLKGMET
jgi:hypothetical protein